MSDVRFRLAAEHDFEGVVKLDPHLSEQQLKMKLRSAEVLVACDGEQVVGVLRWNYFWDQIPFMNLLRIEESYRRRGLGKRLVTHWEDVLRQAGHASVMTSTLADESAQHFYRKLAYIDSGALLLPGEALEILFIKSL